MKKEFTNEKQRMCAPVPLSQIRSFRYGDSFKVTTPNAGFEQGQVLPLYAYCKTPEGMTIITDGDMPRRYRDSQMFPVGTCTEIWFKVIPKTITEIPLATAEEYLEYVPVTEDEAKVIQMWPEKKAVYQVA